MPTVFPSARSRPACLARRDLRFPPRHLQSPLRMNTTRIAELLEPFVGSAKTQRLTTNDLQNISTYIDILLRWNARINLTAISKEEEIVTRHFGESLFAARQLFPARTNVVADAPARPAERSSASTRVIDIGSGAGFPGLPIKIWAPAHQPNPHRVQPKESNLPARSDAQFNIDEHQCIRRPRRSLPQLTRRCSNPPRSRTLRNNPPNRRPPGRTRRPPSPPDRQSPANASPQPGSRTSLATPHPDPPFRKPRPRYWRQSIILNRTRAAITGNKTRTKK